MKARLATGGAGDIVEGTPMGQNAADISGSAAAGEKHARNAG